MDNQQKIKEPKLLLKCIILVVLSLILFGVCLYKTNQDIKEMQTDAVQNSKVSVPVADK